MAGSKAVPGSSKVDSTPKSAKSHKRKRDVETSNATTPTPTKKHKKRESLPSAVSPTNNGSTTKRKRLKDALQGSDSEKETRQDSAASQEKRKKDRVGESGKKSKDGKRKSSGKDSQEDAEPTAVSLETRDEKDAEESSEAEGKRRKSSKDKHAGILSKFERTKTTASAKAKKAKKETKEAKTPAEMNVEPVIAKGLEPLPQPENPPEVIEAPTYSSLPPWLANPLRTSANERAKFSDLGIKPDLLRILEQNNYKEAFAVQSTVIPLLLGGSDNHPGDLCISAATGSGKTLSYVLPLVTSLTARPASRLRGLIVVPTRELVKQAREACELCASGSRLHIGSAVGNVAIKDEQKLLMRVDQIYNPATVAQRQKSGLQGNDWMDFSLEDCVNEAIDSNGFLPGYIQRAEPNVDILICTPGRLVDHIRYTKGFTLKHLEWLVIDEADRLLNESFQEWVDVVMGSLNSRQAPETFGPGGQLLCDLGLSIDTHPPRKVILSATMTRDITKLNSLRLDNPKMVIIGAESTTDAEDLTHTHSDAHYTLPPTLQEHIVAVDDASQKPLYLLRLLLSHIKIGGADNVAKKQAIASIGSDSDSASSDDTSSDESSDESLDESSDDETSSSGSDSDSDSDSSSGSDSDSSSDSSSDASSEESSDSEDEVIDIVPEAKSPRTTVLIFTKSSEAASRLSRLISLLHPPLANRVGTIIKSNKSSASRKTLAAYRRGRISVIVATDRASRGLDLQFLTHVINYDIPPSVTTYVHRVGRTARAGREGSAWSLVAHREGRWFSNEIAASVEGRITRTASIDRVRVKLDSLKSLQSKYATALDELEKEVKVGRARPSKHA
jgi:ATP-dependent RNA helicase DDX51/DBP6